MRLIDADEFEAALENTEYDISPAYEPDGYSHKLICEVLEETPTVDAVPELPKEDKRGQYKAGYDAGFADGFVETLHIVRCRDCKFWEPYGGKGSRNGEDLLEWEGGCMKWRGRHLESDFCSYGKRKVGNNA